LQVGPHGLGDPLRAGGVRMNLVVAVQIGIQHDTFEQEWHKGHVVLSREPREQLMKIHGVVPAVDRRRLHATQQHSNCS
jgi:hypothetical protein